MIVAKISNKMLQMMNRLKNKQNYLCVDNRREGMKYHTSCGKGGYRC